MHKSVNNVSTHPCPKGTPDKEKISHHCWCCNSWCCNK